MADELTAYGCYDPLMICTDRDGSPLTSSPSYLPIDLCPYEVEYEPNDFKVYGLIKVLDGRCCCVVIIPSLYFGQVVPRDMIVERCASRLSNPDDPICNDCHKTGHHG